MSRRDIENYYGKKSGSTPSGPEGFIKVTKDNKFFGGRKRAFTEVKLTSSDLKQESHFLFQQRKKRLIKKSSTGNLSDEQRKILDLVVEQGKSVFFTGPAGAGKSYLLQEIIHQLKEKYSSDSIQITASTGVAACSIGGKTLHSFMGCGLAKENFEVLIKKLLSNKTAVKRWLGTRVLLVDEVSMVSADQIELVDKISKAVRNNNLPFGGIQMVLCGDFFQLPPVPEHNAKAPVKFCFESKAWIAGIQVVASLKTVFRQKDVSLIKILNELRINELSDESVKVLQSLSRPLKGDIRPVELYPTRAEVEKSNRKALDSLTSESKKFDANYDINPANPIMKDSLRKRLEQTSQAPAELELKIGAQVMLLINLDQDEGLVNGSIGIVCGFDQKDGYPVVTFRNQFHIIPKTIIVERHTWEIEENGKVVAKKRQIPLLLAWAMSIHKSQGQTIPFLKIDLSRSFEKGQVYVALSRAVSLDTLELHNFHQSKVMVHPKVIEFNRSIVENK